MKKRIAITQRVDVIEGYGERRDAVDQRWTDLLLKCDCWPVFVPNNERFVRRFLENNSFDGLLLTGGNSLASYGGDAPERDTVERVLLEYAISKGLPVLGVCRGMQVLQNYWGVTLKRVEGHVGRRHRLKVLKNSWLADELCCLKTVNAYHDFGAVNSVSSLPAVAWSEDGVVMAAEHEKLPIFGQMWHSEREEPIIAAELAIFKKVFSRQEGFRV